MPLIPSSAIMLLAALCCTHLAYGEEGGGAATLPAVPASAENNVTSPTQQANRPPDQDVPRPNLIIDFDMYRTAGMRRDGSFSVILLPSPLDISTLKGQHMGFAYDHIGSYRPAPYGPFLMERYSLAFVESNSGFKYAYFGVGWTEVYGPARSSDGTVFLQIRGPLGGPFFAEGKAALPFGAFVSSAYGTYELELALGVGNDNAAFKLGVHGIDTTVRLGNGQPQEFSRGWVFAGFSLAI